MCVTAVLLYLFCTVSAQITKKRNFFSYLFIMWMTLKIRRTRSTCKMIKLSHSDTFHSIRWAKEKQQQKIEVKKKKTRSEESKQTTNLNKCVFDYKFSAHTRLLESERIFLKKVYIIYQREKKTSCALF